MLTEVTKGSNKIIIKRYPRCVDTFNDVTVVQMNEGYFTCEDGEVKVE